MFVTEFMYQFTFKKKSEATVLSVYHQSIFELISSCTVCIGGLLLQNREFSLFMYEFKSNSFEWLFKPQLLGTHVCRSCYIMLQNLNFGSFVNTINSSPPSSWRHLQNQPLLLDTPLKLASNYEIKEGICSLPQSFGILIIKFFQILLGNFKFVPIFGFFDRIYTHVHQLNIK